MTGLNISKPIRRDLGRKGQRPRWMVEALKKGKKMEDFLIHKAR
jgi:hypothetical protein